MKIFEKEILDDKIVDALININKYMKANMMMLSPARNDNSGVWAHIIGCGYDVDNLGFVKKISVNMDQYDPCSDLNVNMFFQVKDLVALQKIREKTGMPIMVEKTTMYWGTNVAIRLYCGEEVRNCYDYFLNYDRYLSFMNWFNDPFTEGKLYRDIRNCPEFDSVFTAKASDGIITVQFMGETLFVVPMALGAVKSDKIDIVLFENTMNQTAKGIKFIIHKNKGVDVELMYKYLNPDMYLLSKN